MLLRELEYSIDGDVRGRGDYDEEWDGEWHDLEVIINREEESYIIRWTYKEIFSHCGDEHREVFSGWCEVPNSDDLDGIICIDKEELESRKDNNDNGLFLGEFDHALEDIISVVAKDELWDDETLLPRALNRLMWDYVM